MSDRIKLAEMFFDKAGNFFDENKFVEAIEACNEAIK